MDTESDSQRDLEFRLAYLSRASFDDGKAYRGGVLVVDNRGTPKEFRCTSPIRPNAVQRTLYGDSLDPYMLIELIGKPLLGSLRENVNAVLVDSPFFLNLRRLEDRTIVFLRRQGAEFSRQNAPSAEQDAELLDSATGRFETLVVESFEEAAGDVRAALPLLQQAASSFDPLEPFERVQRALEKVHEQQALDR